MRRRARTVASADRGRHCARRVRGDLTVGAGSTFDLGTGSLALGCADLDVAGTLTAGSVGFSAARDITINPSGTLNATPLCCRCPATGTTRHVQRGHEHRPDGRWLRALQRRRSRQQQLREPRHQHHQRKAGELHSRLDPDGDGTALAARRRGQPAPDPQHAEREPASFNVTGTSNVSFVNVQDNNALPGNDISLPVNSVKGTNTPGWLSASGAVARAGRAGRARALAARLRPALALAVDARWTPRSDPPRAGTAVRSRRPRGRLRSRLAIRRSARRRDRHRQRRLEDRRRARRAGACRTSRACASAALRGRSRRSSISRSRP